MWIKIIIKKILNKIISNNTEVENNNIINQDIEFITENIPDELPICIDELPIFIDDSSKSKIKEIDNLAYIFYLYDYNKIYKYHDKSPAELIEIVNHYNYNKLKLSHEHDSIDEYYEKANKILRKNKLDKLNDN